MNELPPRVRSFLTICVPFLRTPLKKKCVPLTSKSVYPQRGTHNFINVRILKTLASSAADQALSIPGTRKTLQVLSCKVYGGDSWTRTNSSRFMLRMTAHRADASLVCPVDVNDVLYQLSHATINKMKIWKPGKTWLMAAAIIFLKKLRNYGIIGTGKPTWVFHSRLELPLQGTTMGF